MTELKIGEFLDITYYIDNEEFDKAYQTINHVDNMDDISYDDVLLNMVEYKNYITVLFDKYPSLFSGESDVDEIEYYKRLGLEPPKHDDIVHDGKSVWYDILFNLFANGDYLKMNQVFNLRLIEVLNHMNYLNIKNKK